jgi:hypothetical protein
MTYFFFVYLSLCLVVLVFDIFGLSFGASLGHTFGIAPKVP